MDLPLLRIRLLGELDLRLGARILPPLEGARVRSLLGYLLLHRDRPQPRQHLAFLLWADSTEAQARTNLRHVLHRLRRVLPDPSEYLVVTPQTLQWRPDAPFWLDVAAFETEARPAEPAADEHAIARLRKCAELYTGDLLEGCYDEWLEADRAALRQRYLEVLERLTTLLEARGEVAEAVAHAERLLRHDPMRESTYRMLMRLHDARGDRARAVRVYRDCEAALEQELGVTPAAETRELYETLLAPAAPSTDGARGRVGPSSATPARPPGLAAWPVGLPLVGRAGEWARVTRLWREVEAGQARLLLVTGESGIGKTRLIEELRAWCATRGAATAAARSYAVEGGLAYAPLVAWLRAEPIRERLPRIDRSVLAELARLLPELASRLPDLPTPQPLPVSDRRQPLFDAAAAAIRATAQPLLLVADDIQWCDAETLGFVHYLLRLEPAAPLLVAATARVEEMHGQPALRDLMIGLRAEERVTEIELCRLTVEATTDLARSLGAGMLQAADAAALFRDTEGNPLFIIEALRAGWRPDATEVLRLSPKVNAVIESRLARLTAPARELAGVAATFGRGFTAGLLQLAVGDSADEIVRGLDELWRCDVVREHDAGIYDFAHPRIREVAYAALGPARRMQLHGRAAAALKRHHGYDPGPVSGQIAAHYDRAGVVSEAVDWYEAAAEAAQRLGASGDAVRLLSRALELIQPLRHAPEHRARELALLTALLTPLAVTEGFISDRLAGVQRNAVDVARDLGVDPPPQLLRSLAIASLCREDFGAAQRYGAELCARGRSEGAESLLLVESDYVLGITAFWQGHLQAARGHFEAAAASPGADRRRAHLLRYGFDPQVICLSRLGNTLCLMGDAAPAARARDDALALADRVAHQNTRATTIVFAAMQALELEETDRLRWFVAELERGCGDALQNRIAAGVLSAHVRLLDGEIEAGLAFIRGALADPHGAAHAPGMRGLILRVLLAACRAAGDARGRLAAADDLLRRGGAARLWEAEAHRARAESLAVLGASAAEVEAALASAIDVARCQGAGLFETRAAQALHRCRLAAGGAAGPVAPT